MRQTCKVCKRKDKFDFHVPDEIWEAIVPPIFRGLVVCLECFDAFAADKNIDYARHLKVLYFTGDKAAIEFKAKLAIDIDPICNCY